MTQTSASRLAGPVQHMCFVTVDGDLYLAAARSQGVELLDSVDGSSVRVVYDRGTGAMAALPGPDGTEFLLVGGADGRIHGLDPRTGVERLGRTLGTGEIKDLEVFADGPHADVVAILDTGVHVWRPQTDTVTRLPDPDGSDPSHLFKVCAYLVDRDRWVTAAYTDGLLATWNLDRPGTPALHRAHDGPIWSLVNTVDDGRAIVISGGSDRRMRVWSPDEAEGLRAREEFVADGTIRRLGHLADRGTTMLLTASASGAVSLWRLDGSPERPEMEVSRHSGEAWALVCAPTLNGVLIASGDMNGDIKVKRLSTALLAEDTVSTLFQTDTTIWAVTHEHTSHGAYIAGAGVGQTIHVIDPAGERDNLALHRHSSTVRALTAFGGPNHPHLVSGGADHRVYDWDPGTGQLRSELPMGHEGEVWALTSFVDNGVRHVVSGSADGSVRVIPVDVPLPTMRVLASDCGEVSAVVVVPAEDDFVVVIASGRGLRGISLRHGTSRPLSLTGISVACGVVDAGRQLVVAARQDGVVELIDPLAAASVSLFDVSYGSGQVRALQRVDVSGTTFILGGCDDGRVLVWHIDGTLVSSPVRGGTAGIRSMDVVEIARTAGRGGRAESQSALISAGHDGTIRLWPITVDSPLRSGGSVGRGVRPASILLQDQPTNTDLLSRDPLVDTLHAALTSPNTKPPVVVGVHAPWGHGKSSLLRQIQTKVDPWVGQANGRPREASHRLTVKARSGKLESVRTRLTRAWAWRQIQRSGDHNAPLPYEMRPANPDHDAITVWFNPWMYERTDQIWAGLTREILIAITERLPKPERERLWFDLNLRRTDPAAMRKRILASYIPRTIWGLAIGVALLFLVVVAVVSMGIAAVNNPTVAGLLPPSTLVLLTVLGTIAQATSGSFKQIHGWVSPDELNSRAGPEHAWKGTTDPLTSTDRGYLYMLQHDVGEVVGLATKHGTLYVFIDDLDRCGPAIVADTIEAINLFLNKAFGQCVFVVALDPATVAAHLETSFADINDRAREDATSFGHLRHTGWRFMEKIIDLPIRLPRVPDTALSQYLDGLLDATRGPAAPAITLPSPVTQGSATPAPAASPDEAAKRAPRQRPADADEATGERAGRTTVEVLVMPDAPSTDGSVAAVEALEELPPVRDALRAAVLSLPARNPRQTKAFINLWRFYMVLDHRMGLFSPSLLAIQRHSIEMARLVELMVRWPYLLDPLGELAGEGVVDSKTTNLDRLLEACGQDDPAWGAAAREARMDPDDRTIQGLRELLRRAQPHGQVFAAIARRYL